MSRWILPGNRCRSHGRSRLANRDTHLVYPTRARRGRRNDGETVSESARDTQIAADQQQRPRRTWLAVLLDRRECVGGCVERSITAWHYHDATRGAGPAAVEPYQTHVCAIISHRNS